MLKIGGKYYLYGHGAYAEWLPIPEDKTPYFRLSSNSINGPFLWETVEICWMDISNCMNKAAINAGTDYIWHKSLRKVANNLYISTFVLNADNAAQSSIWIAWSMDGVNFTAGKYPIMSPVRDYSSSTGPDVMWDHFFYIPDTTFYFENKELKFNLWYIGQSRISGNYLVSKLGHSVLRKVISGVELATTFAGQNIITAARNTEVAVANTLSGKWWFADDFNRPDETKIVVSSCGKTWTMYGAFTAGIKDNHCINTKGGYPATTAGWFCITDDTPVDYEATMDMFWAADRSGTGTSSYIYYKYAQGFIMFYSTAIRVYIATTRTSKFSVKPYIKHDTYNEIKIQWYGSTNTLKLYMNGFLIFTETITVADFVDQAAFDVFLAARKFGYKFYADSSDKIKNITIKDLT